ncbi:protein geranylgeranyltransferase type I subunit CDC43 [Aspergillus homomorphus CBS 101889]|uniref:Geranylgeranyl transferase beta subunit n=1 Tax=Aspergillus homomorphus (strain CBS 101889) TaxID=1450537 RepID=A0A395HPB6_ASPHC|nr:geranylgeranyl transferase beta subunit [Aspergillus homomorphus CBS 101889]RAL09466.1 geranylgeranyl transferase beta subunit [Aspergillus homomorphus CBS 101889]
MTEVIFNRERHIKYFLRCLKTFLPEPYTFNDSNRMLLAFFTVAGLDILGVLQDKTTPEERQGYVDWIYQCQVPTGGFRGFTGTDFGVENRSPVNEAWDPANVPSTFFALVILIILGDDLSRVKRLECLRWLPQLQRENGSFGEVLGPGGKIEGGGDLRFCCCAAGTRYILRGKDGADIQGLRDIDVTKLATFVQACQAYDGGMGEAPFCEAHSGHTYCAIGTLSFLSRMVTNQHLPAVLSPGATEFETLVRWLVSRQTAELGEVEEDFDEGDEQIEISQCHKPLPTVAVEEADLDAEVDELPALLLPTEASLRWAGFNGRCNKYADTCYSFWNLATLVMVDRLSLVDADRNHRYLLDKTQHIIGGFGKGVGEPPDLLHSYFGLVALAFQGEQGLGSVDPALCISQRAVDHLHSLPWWRGNV